MKRKTNIVKYYPNTPQGIANLKDDTQVLTQYDFYFEISEQAENKILAVLSGDYDMVCNLLNIESNISISESSYLAKHTYQQLMDIIYYKDKNPTFLVAEALQILQARNKSLSEQQLQQLWQKRLTEIRHGQALSARLKFWAILSIFLGGWLAILLGFYIMTTKTKDPTNNIYLKFNAKARKFGLQVFSIGILVLLGCLYITSLFI